MQDFRSYSYTIRIEDVEKAAREAAAIGAEVYMIINGEYYEIETATDAGQPDTLTD